MGSSLFRKRRTITLRFKLAVGGILILLIPLTIVGVITYVKSAHALEKIARQKLVQVSCTLAEMVQISLQKDLDKLAGIAADPRVIRDMKADEFECSMQVLAEVYPLLAADFEGVALYDTDGVIRVDGADPDRVGMSIADRDYFRMTMAGQTGMGAMRYSRPTGDPVFFLAAPVFSPSGEVLGAVLGAMRAEYLMQYISSIELGETGYLFMVDQTGMLVAHPVKEKVLNGNIKDRPELAELFENIKEREACSVEYCYEGHNKLAGICDVPLTGWYIGATQHKKEIMHVAYTNMRFLLLVGGVSLVLVGLMVFFFSKSVSAPVQIRLDTLSQAVNQAAEAFLLIGSNGLVQFVNPAASRILGFPAEVLVGSPFSRLIASDSDVAEIRRCLAHASGWSGRVEGVRDDNNPYTLDFNLSPVLGPGRKPLCHLAVGRDMTRELSMQEQLRQSQKMEAIGTLAGGIAHDFNNILGAIFGFAELGLLDLDDRMNLERYLNEIIHSAMRARDLVKHILTFSRRGSPDREPLILKVVVREAINLLRASLPVTIDMKVSLNSSASVLGNMTQIHQIIMNLGTNAGYAMKDRGGTLFIFLDEVAIDDDQLRRLPDLSPGRYLRLRVSDTGHGIPECVQQRLFEPFFTTKPTGQGSGLGLSVVHGIVKSLDGGITVESEDGKGAVFEIFLPVVTEQTSSAPASATADLPGGNEHLLIVDDEQAITEVLQSLMCRLGYRVDVFSSGIEALNAFEKSPAAFDLIITDYTMPHMTGTVLAEKIRALRRDIPIILCSGNLSMNDQLDGLQPMTIVKKPASSREMAEAVRRMLDSA